MKNLIAALTIFVASFNAHALEIDPLTPGQIVGEAVFVGLLVADYKQTKQISTFCDGRSSDCDVYETNPLLGRKPSDERVRNYFIGAAVTHVVLTMMIPTEYRAAWLASGITVQAVVVGKNKRLGLNVKF